MAYDKERKGKSEQCLRLLCPEYSIKQAELARNINKPHQYIFKEIIKRKVETEILRLQEKGYSLDSSLSDERKDKPGQWFKPFRNISPWQ